jgi:putative protease
MVHRGNRSEHSHVYQYRSTLILELVCPAGNLPSLKAAVDNGADAVYVGFRDDTNARHFAGLNFNDESLATGVRYAKDRGKRVFVAINTYPQPAGWSRWQAAVDQAVRLGVDALIMADIGLLDYAAKRWPRMRLHLSVQGSATNPEAIRFYHEHFGIRRAVLPRVLSLNQVWQVIEHSPVPVEVFGFGSLCVMAEGRCILSSYVTGKSPNNFGACSPASAVRWSETPSGLELRLNGILINRQGKGENAGYPTLCKGRFQVGRHTYYAIEEPTSLNTIEILPELQELAVAAIKIEGRQRSPAYVAKVTRVWRMAMDACRKNPGDYQPLDSWLRELEKVSEGAQTTLGAYHRAWQ